MPTPGRNGGVCSGKGFVLLNGIRNAAFSTTIRRRASNQKIYLIMVRFASLRERREDILESGEIANEGIILE
ncbi:hypothetical protein TNCV_2577241 [Trichonephila clavipes]|nr:hypothetical protein TNCV_2577241 [Trichonephila clavipes]